ncbi:MAG: molecular chaperone TorD family protein [Actinomycetia bacterium]|nr:molecular chaperone TorD family protein [Actinomycetes bacterium]
MDQEHTGRTSPADGEQHPSIDEKRQSSAGDNAEWMAAVGRAAIYGFLSRSLLFPTSESRDSLHHELVPLLGSMSSSSGELDELIAAAVRANDIDLEELRFAHGRVFTHIENKDCPAHESAYSPGDVFRRADLMADVAAFYRAHGLHLGGTQRERVDHITTELEFMSFLARKEAYAIENLGPEQVEECQRSQTHFLCDHLGCWAGGFSDRLQIVADHPYFVATGSLLSAWIETDLTWLDVEPVARQSEPQPLPPPDDSSCGADTDDMGSPVEIGR